MTAAVGEQAQQPGRHPGLDWVLESLWLGTGEVRVCTGSHIPSGCRAEETFAVLPSAAHPRLLVPLASRRAAAAALSDYRSGKRVVRLAKPALSLAIRAGAGRVVLRDRVHIGVAQDLPPAALSSVLLREHLREILGRRDLETAIRFDTPRPHRKPTIHILSRTGAPLGFAKVGWNELTRALVRNEGRVLQDLGCRVNAPREFEAPKLIYAGRWRELEILVVAPVPVGASGRKRRLLAEPPRAATMEVAELAAITQAPLAESSYWMQVTERLAATEAALDGSARSGLRAAVEEIERCYGEIELLLGSWHGDWVPWNMGYYARRLHVWDWEHSGARAPVGLDAVHYDFQAELGLRGTPPWRAVQRTVERSGPLLASLGIEARLAPLLLLLHLLEMSLRFEEARAAGVDTHDPKYLDALTRFLRMPEADRSSPARTAAARPFIER